jgi:hypothetical protein
MASLPFSTLFFECVSSRKEEMPKKFYERRSSELVGNHSRLEAMHEKFCKLAGIASSRQSSYK